MARHNLKRGVRAKRAYREGYFCPPTENGAFYSQQSSNLMDSFAWNRTACLEGRKSMKALVIKTKLLHFSEVVCLKSVFISLIVTTRTTVLSESGTGALRVLEAAVDRSQI